MKYASSIRFGGQLIDAKDCGYEDYKRLGLLCPECKDPVFLKAEGVRQQGGKEVKIGAHFSHFATKNPELAKVCENRIKGYTQADLDRAIAKARGQRLKLLQRWFWDVFSSRGRLCKAYSDRLLDYQSSVAAKHHRTKGVLSKNHLEVFKDFDDLDGVSSKLRAIAVQHENPTDRDLKNLCEGLEDLLTCSEGCDKSGGTPIDEFVSEQWGPLYPFNSIALEVIEFLLASRQRPMLLEICRMWELTQVAIVMNEECSDAVKTVLDPEFLLLIDEYFGWGLKYEDHLKTLVEEKTAWLLFCDIACIDWVGEFARLSAESKVGAA